MKTIVLLLLTHFFIHGTYSQTLSDEQLACKCTVKRVAGDRERSSLRLIVTAKVSDNSTLRYDGDTFWLTDDSTEYAIYREFSLNRIFSYPYLYLTHQRKIYKLDMEEERLYAGSTVIGVAQNATEAFELLTTQILLPQKCQQAYVSFTARQSRNLKMPPLLPGSLYN